MAEPSTEVLVVTHTHWDREWYHTAERFRQRLVRLVDELLDDPPGAGASFLLDGQAVLLDDYLAVRPDRAAELASLIRGGVLEAGPWYVLADELIPSGEALVRNLLAGRATVRRLRGEPPPVLYCPDSFGHPAILPELARGFGCEVVLLWRGYGGARWPAGDTARWRGPSGAEVLLYHLPPDGYEFGSSLPVDVEAAGVRWRRMSEVLLPRATTGVTLLLNGADHHARQRDLPAALAALSTAAVPAAVRATSLHEASARIVDAASRATLPVVQGELRDSYGYTWTLGGTLATRTAQKRRNAQAERALVRDVEPWIALGGAQGARRALLDATWRDLLRGHPHDTLCGTSIDAVAAALDERLATVESQVAGLREDATATLIGHDADAARVAPSMWRPALVLRNRAARTRSGVAEVTLAFKLADVAVGPGSGSRQGNVREPGDEGMVSGAQALGRERVVRLTESPRAYPDADLVEETRALVWVEAMAGYTIESRLLPDQRANDVPHPVRASAGVIENGPLRVAVSDDGRVRLECANGDRVIDDTFVLEAHRDVGDSYTPAIREPLAAFEVVSVRTTHEGPLRAELEIRYHTGNALSDVTMRLQLDAGLDALRVLVDGVSAMTDARLRLVARGHFAEGGGMDGYVARSGDDAGRRTQVHSEFGGAPHVIDGAITTVADAAFYPVTRTVPRISDADARVEHVVPTAPLHRYVSRYAADRGMTLFSDGLAEYESLADGGVAVTLLRAIGALSLADLPERPGHAGWPADTPGAQGAGPFHAELALSLHGPDSPAQRDRMECLADDILLPIVGETLRSNLSDAVVAGGLELDGAGLAFSAAMPSREPGWITLRCVNRRDASVHGTWHFRRPVLEAARARLDETREEALAVSGASIPFTARPMEIVTILARLA